MKLKKALILFGLLTTLSSTTTPFLESDIQTNNDTILVNNEKVNLRQKAIKKANSNTIDEANIETTNVDYDLRYLFGGEKNYLKYNIWDLKPTSLDSKDTSFKFICAKPVGTNLYLYVYHNDNRNGDILSATFNVSKSKVQNKDTGEFEESFTRYNARFINSYGYKERFMKFAIDNIISTTEDVRCFIDDCYITYQDTSTTKNYYSNVYDVNDEFAFNVGSGTDFMYQYFKDDYVRITDGEVSCLLTGKSLTNINLFSNAYCKYNEDFYYFFNSDRKIDELMEVQYDYDLITYNATMKWDDSEYRLSNKECGVSYNGLINYTGYSGKYQNEPTKIDITNQTHIVNNVIKNNTYVEEVERPYFLWWNQKVKYNVTTIQDCLDTSNLTGDENKGFKEFIENIQNNRVLNNKSKYQWAFKVHSDVRKTTNTWNESKWWSILTLKLFGGSCWSETQCHEVKQAMITWLKFRTHNQEFEFNVLDVPKDTTSIHIQNVPFETLGDVIVEKVNNIWDWFKDAFNNIKNNLVPMLISLAVIVVVVACWPVVTSVTRLVGTSINMLTDKKVKKKSKNKRE